MFNNEYTQIAVDDRAMQILRNLCNACLKDAVVERLSGKGDDFSLEIFFCGHIFSLYTTPRIMQVLEKLCKEFCKDKGAVGAELIESTRMMIGAVIWFDEIRHMQPFTGAAYENPLALCASAVIYTKAGISEAAADIVGNIKKHVRSIAENSEISSATIGDDVVGRVMRSSYVEGNKPGTDFNLMVAEAQYTEQIVYEHLLDCMSDGVRHIVNKCIAPIVAALGECCDLSSIFSEKKRHLNKVTNMNRNIYEFLIVKIIMVELYSQPVRRNLHDSRYTDLVDAVERDIARVCCPGNAFKVVIGSIEQVEELLISEAQAELAGKTQEHSHAMN